MQRAIDTKITPENKPAIKLPSFPSRLENFSAWTRPENVKEISFGMLEKITGAHDRLGLMRIICGDKKIIVEKHARGEGGGRNYAHGRGGNARQDYAPPPAAMAKIKNKIMAHHSGAELSDKLIEHAKHAMALGWWRYCAKTVEDSVVALKAEREGLSIKYSQAKFGDFNGYYSKTASEDLDFKFIDLSTSVRRLGFEKQSFEVLDNLKNENFKSFAKAENRAWIEIDKHGFPKPEIKE